MNHSRAIRSRQAISRCLLFSLVACFAGSAWCQDGKSSARPTPPTGVLLNAPPEFSQWTIAFMYPQDQPPQADSKRPAINGDLTRTVVVTKTKNIFHEETVSVSGTKFDKWQICSKFYVKPAGQLYWGEYDPTFVRNNPTSDVRFLPLPENKFRDLDWIDCRTYAGSSKEQGREYLLFVPVSSASVDFSNAAEVKAQPVIAYVDAATRLPVVFKHRDTIQQYTFGDAPTGMQSLPADLALEIKTGDEKHAKVFAQPHKEY